MTCRTVLSRAFTTIELLITIAIVAILIAVAAPSLSDAMTNVQVSGQVNDLVTGLALARSEAVKRAVRTGVCIADAAGTACAGGSNWDRGWIVFVDADADGNVDATAGSIISRRAAFEGRNTLTRLDDGGALGVTRVAFSASGTSVVSAGAIFLLCDARNVRPANYPKQINVLPTGRAVVLDARQISTLVTRCPSFP